MTKYVLLGEMIDDLLDIIDIFTFEVMTDREEDENDEAFVEGLKNKVAKYEKMKMEVMFDE